MIKKVLVVGGSGFLGTALSRELKRQGKDIRTFDLIPHPDSSIPSITGDLRDPERIDQACKGMDTVFQTASLVDWGPRSRQRLYDINVKGNQNVIAACQKHDVHRLIYTSSIDVVFDGTPIANGDETIPYPHQHLDDYGRTKMLAERDVIRADGQYGLRTCSLRTAGIYGPGDRHRLPPILRAAQQGKLVHLGDGSAKFGHVYITNVVHAHLLAAETLTTSPQVAGQCYFISDHEASNFFEFFVPYLKALGYSPPQRRIPHKLAHLLAILMEGIARLGIGPQPPLLTRYVVASTCVDFYFSHAKASRDFGYQPIVSYEQAQQETLHWLMQSSKQQLQQKIRE